MKKKMNSILTGLVLAGLAVFLTAEGAKAFCLHNLLDKTVYFEQLPKGTNNFTLGPGEKVICSRNDNKSCNRRPESIVRFDVYYYQEFPDFFERPPKKIYICEDFRIPWNGFLAIYDHERALCYGGAAEYQCE